MEREVTIKGLNEQRVYIAEYPQDVLEGKHNVFISSYAKPAEPHTGSYVNREKFLKKIAKFFNVVIYDVGYVEYVEGGVMTDQVEFTQTDVGYHRYTEED